MRNNSIKLNGVIYTRKNLDEFNPKESWQTAILQFLQNWFDDTDYILAQTSGSTGIPKEIRLSKTAMENSAQMTNKYFGLNAGKTALLCLPASYIAGKMMLVRALVGGFNLICVEPKANPFLTVDQPIDFTSITPYQLQHSAEALKETTIKNIIVGGGHVNSKMETQAQSIPASLYETYGMTETSSHIALRCFNGENKSVYFSVLEGISISQDERGCLVVKAPHLLSDEIQTNDIVELIGLQSFRWLGRIDSVINSGGVKIHPEQVEKKLEGIIVFNYFVTSIPDELLENRVVLVIESEVFNPDQESALKSILTHVLERYEIPKQILYVPAFVYSTSNKVLRLQTVQKINSTFL